MTETVITTTEKPAPSLAEIFNAFSQKAVRDFPQLENRFLLYSATTDTTHGSPGSRSRAREEVAELKGCIELYRQEDSLPEAFSERLPDYYKLAYALKPDQDIDWVLEHELGHLVGPGGVRYIGEQATGHSSNFCESLADAFALLRLQGNPAPAKNWAEAISWGRTRQFTLGQGTGTFTLPVLSELCLLLQSYDCSKLTGLQTANIAYRLALQYTPLEIQLRGWEKIFSSVGEDAGPSLAALEDTLKKFADIMLADHGQNIKMRFAIGKTILTPFLDHNLEVLQKALPADDISDFRLEGAFWDDIRVRIKSRAEQLKETPEQALAHKLDHMQVMGYFDRHPDRLIDPKQYESAENQAYIKQKRAAYGAQLARTPAAPLPPKMGGGGS